MRFESRGWKTGLGKPSWMIPSRKRAQWGNDYKGQRKSTLSESSRIYALATLRSLDIKREQETVSQRHGLPEFGSGCIQMLI